MPLGRPLAWASSRASPVLTVAGGQAHALAIALNDEAVAHVRLIRNRPVQFKSWPGLDARGDILTCKGVEGDADQAEGQPHPEGRSVRLVHALYPP